MKQGTDLKVRHTKAIFQKEQQSLVSIQTKNFCWKNVKHREKKKLEHLVS